MESVGKIIKILPARTGTSERTGNAWVVQPFLLEVRTGEHGQYTKKQLFEVFGEDKIKQFQLFEGKTVKVMFDLEAKEGKEGTWFNSTRVWDMKEMVPQTQPQQSQYGQQPTQGQYGQQPQQRPQNGFYQPVQQGYQNPTPYYQPQQHNPYQPNVDPVTGEPLPF